MHEARRVSSKNLNALKLSILKVGDHEAGKIGGRGRKSAGGGLFDDFKRLGLARAHRITFGHQRLQFRRQGLREARSRHAKRLEDIRSDIIIEWLAGDAFHNVSRQSGAIVGIGRSCSWRKDSFGNVMRQVFVQSRYWSTFF